MNGAARMVTRLDGTSRKLEDPSCKPQASSAKLIERQAASRKPRAASIKRQAASDKLPNIFSFIKIRETRGEGLY
jgi:hypothetical protein